MTVLSAILEVFTAVGAWIPDTMLSLVPIFWSAEGLTFFGVLSVSGLSISVILLFLALVQRFMHFAG